MALITNKLLPTIESKINLTYINQEEMGEKILPISLVADEDIITAITVKNGDNILTSYRNSSEIMGVDEQTKNLEIVNTVVNNNELNKSYDCPNACA